MNITDKQLLKFKTLLLKGFDKANDYENVEDIKTNFIMSSDNVIGLEIKDLNLRRELLPYFNKNTTNNIKLSFMDESGSFFDYKLLLYCIKLLRCFENKKSIVTKEKCVYLNSGFNKPIVLENNYIKIYLCNMYCEEVF